MAENKENNEIDKEEGWYSSLYGIHQHPEEWPLAMAKRAHERCRKVWVEKKENPDNV